MWKEKLGNYLIDISKYVLTGIVIASLFKDVEDKRFLIYTLGLLVAMATLIAGLILSNKKRRINNGINFCFISNRITMRHISVMVPYSQREKWLKDNHMI